MQITHSNGHELRKELEFWSLEELLNKYNELNDPLFHVIDYKFMYGRAGFEFETGLTMVFDYEDKAGDWLAAEIHTTICELMEDVVEDWASQRSLNWRAGTGL